MDIASSFDLRVEQVDGLEFRVRFDKPQFPDLTVDEPPPLGHDRAPNAARVLAAAIGNCLAASLVFCLERSGVKASGVSADVHVDIVRNEAKRLRIGRVKVKLQPHVPAEALARLERCSDLFEDYCIVTQSVRKGIDVQVELDRATAHAAE